jgi:putative Mg2+ transporter-C (MgtC) family protein
MIIKILLSIALGFLIGLERDVTGKSIGIRTVSLITLGCTLFTLMSPDAEDNSRIVAQIVSGLGFLGAGVIFKHNATIKGLTTAATIFCSGSIGALVGLNFFKEAVLGTIAIIFINLVFKHFKDEISPRHTSEDL